MHLIVTMYDKTKDQNIGIINQPVNNYDDAIQIIKILKVDLSDCHAQLYDRDPSQDVSLVLADNEKLMRMVAEEE